MKFRAVRYNSSIEWITERNDRYERANGTIYAGQIWCGCILQMSDGNCDGTGDHRYVCKDNDIVDDRGCDDCVCILQNAVTKLWKTAG